MSSIYQKPNGNWYLGLMVHDPKKGRVQKCFSLKTKSRKEAIEKSRKLEEELKSSSLEDLLFQWVVRKIQNRSHRTIEDGKNHMKEMIGYFGNRSSSSITTNDLRSYRTYLYSKKLSRGTVRIRLATLKATFNWGFKEGLVSHKPFLGLEFPKINGKIEFLSKEEIIRFLELASENKLHRLWFEFFLHTGCTRGEFNNLKWSDISDSVLTFNGKTGSRKFPINEDLKNTLSEIKKFRNMITNMWRPMNMEFGSENTIGFHEFVKII